MKKTKKRPVAKYISVTVMCLCLFFLTGANFCIYPPSTHAFCTSSMHHGDPNDEESPAPEEERSSARTGLSVQEEYTCELHMIKDLSAFVVLSKHKIPAAEKLQIVHFELVSPPPKA